MSDPDLSELRKRAGQGEKDAVGQLVELAGERGDFVEPRRLADEGSSDAAGGLVEVAGERGDGNSAEVYTLGGLLRPSKHLGRGDSNVMPSEYADKLTRQEIADLIAYLHTLQ